VEGQQFFILSCQILVNLSLDFLNFIDALLDSVEAVLGAILHFEPFRRQKFCLLTELTLGKSFRIVLIFQQSQALRVIIKNQFKFFGSDFIFTQLFRVGVVLFAELTFFGSGDQIQVTLEISQRVFQVLHLSLDRLEQLLLVWLGQLAFLRVVEPFLDVRHQGLALVVIFLQVLH